MYLYFDKKWIFFKPVKPLQTYNEYTLYRCNKNSFIALYNKKSKTYQKRNMMWITNIKGKIFAYSNKAIGLFDGYDKENNDMYYLKSCGFILKFN